ncbi:MAG: hypothetical protein M3O50_14460, partial [Myxococcota bacterium]|nr:hypothetical protein [Myxococcota bacterium]
MNTSSVSNAGLQSGPRVSADSRVSGAALPGRGGGTAHAAARPGGGSEGSPKIALEAAGTTFLPRTEPPGGVSVFACLLRQPPPLAEEPLSGGEPRGGSRPRSFSHDEEASGRAEVPRRGVATDAVAGAGNRHEPVPAALAPPP